MRIRVTTTSLKSDYIGLTDSYSQRNPIVCPIGCEACCSDSGSVYKYQYGQYWYCCYNDKDSNKPTCTAGCTNKFYVPDSTPECTSSGYSCGTAVQCCNDAD